jgi:hypothetical protein
MKKLGIGMVWALIVLPAVTGLATTQGPVPYYGGGSYYCPGSSAGYYPYCGRSYGSAPLNPYGSWSSDPHNRFGGSYSWSLRGVTAKQVGNPRQHINGLPCWS